MSLYLLTRAYSSEKQAKKPFLFTNPALPSRAAVHPLVQLQLRVGNRVVDSLVQARRVTAETGFAIQPKLVVGLEHDHYEQEADAVARRIMTMPAPAAVGPVQRQAMPDEKEKEKTLQTKPLAASITPLVQRQTAPEEDKEKKSIQTRPLADAITPDLQREMVPEEDKEKKPMQAKLLTTSPLVQREMRTEEEKEKREQPIQAKLSGQRAAGTESFEAGTDLEARVSRSKGGGSALPDPVRSYMEPRFGVDFSRVRVHTDPEATEMNRAVGAQAFTHGENIYFGAGKSPCISDLMAHELTHVIQQTGGKPLPSSPPRSSFLASRRIQRYTVPSTLDCEDVVDWLDQNSPYSPEWAQTSYTYTFHGNLRISPPVTSSDGVSLTVTGHSGLRVSVNCPIDSPQWAPSPRPDRPEVVAAWRRMKASLDTHEQQHRAIGRAWRATLEARFRVIRFTVTGVDRADAMEQVREEIASRQQQWIDEAQAAQDAVDPFTGAVLICP